MLMIADVITLVSLCSLIWKRCKIFGLFQWASLFTALFLSVMLESKPDAHLANEFRWSLASSVYSMMFQMEHPRHRNLLARRRLGAEIEPAKRKNRL